MARGIYRYTCDAGRHGTITGIFTEESENVEKRKRISVRVGNLGKYFDVYSDDSDIWECISEDPSDVDWFDALKLGTGVNPCNVYTEEEEEE